jgi:hypothetical protein
MKCWPEPMARLSCRNPGCFLRNTLPRLWVYLMERKEAFPRNSSQAESAVGMRALHQADEFLTSKA